LDALAGQSADVAQGGKHWPVVVSQFGKAASQSAPPVHAGPHMPASDAVGSSWQLGAEARVQPAWLVQSPTQIPPAPQLGSVESGQSALAAHWAAHSPVAGSQLGEAESMQSALTLHAPKHVPPLVQFGIPTGHAMAGQGP
jgi:hypothetical protein